MKVKDWVHKEVTWRRRKFYKRRVWGRLGSKSLISKFAVIHDKASKLGYNPGLQVLVRKIAPFRIELLIPIQKSKKGDENVIRLSGRYITEYYSEPITLRPATRAGMIYNLPKGFDVAIFKPSPPSSIVVTLQLRSFK